MAVPVAAPTNVNIQQGNTQIFLSWDIDPAATSGYSVQRSTDGVNFSGLATPAVNNYLDSAVTVGTLYYYQIASVNGSGTGPFSQSFSITPAKTGQISLGELRLRAQQRCDMINNNFITTSEWNFYINQAYFELYDLLITVYEDYYVAPKLTFTTTGAQLYSLPDGVNYSSAPPFYKMFGVEIGLGGQNAFATLKKFDFISRNRYVYPQITTTLLGVFNLQYRVIGGNIMFIPTPQANQTIGLWYFPRLITLLQDTDIADGISGWEEYVIIDSAIRAMIKEESDITALMAQKTQMRQRIEESAMNRDAGQPDTISDTRTWSERWGGMGGMGFDGPTGGF